MESPFNVSEVDMDQYMGMNRTQMGTRYPLEQRPTTEEYFTTSEPAPAPSSLLEDPVDVTPIDSTHVFHPQFDTNSLYEAEDKKKKSNVKSWLEKYWWIILLVVVLVVGGIGFYWWKKSSPSSLSSPSASPASQPAASSSPSLPDLTTL